MKVTEAQENGGYQGLQKGAGSSSLPGTEFHFGEMRKFKRWAVGTFANSINQLTLFRCTLIND